MERRDAVLLLLMLAGGGYAVYANWTKISDKLGLDDFGPARLKAIDLAKRSNDLEQYRTNADVLMARQKSREIFVRGDPWSAEPVADHRFVVTFSFLRDDDAQRLRFDVDTAKRTVLLLDGPYAKPR